MHAPTYRWTCHKCEHVNEPGVSGCGACGFPSVVSAIDLGKTRNELAAEALNARSGGKRWLLTVLAYLGLLPLVGVTALVFALLLAETHSGLLPDPLRPFAFILAWVAVLVLPVLGARAVWRRFGV